MASPADTLFAVEDLVVRYGDHPVLQGVGLQIRQGERIGLLGPNGAGKTTLLKVLCRLLPASSGSVLFRGLPLAQWDRWEYARRVAYLPQQSQILFPYSAWEVVSMGRLPHQAGSFFESAEDRRKVREALELTHCLALAGRPFQELSGGEQQLVCLAAALAQEPEVLLLDEPTVFLDLKHQLQVFEILDRLHRLRQVTIVLVTHDLRLAAAGCRRLVLLKQGRVAADLVPGPGGLPASLLEDVFEIRSEQLALFSGLVAGSPGERT
ncbi:MAG: heme ABC transporter ATP-binding protein [Acidobacteriota bacterium]